MWCLVSRVDRHNPSQAKGWLLIMRLPETGMCNTGIDAPVSSGYHGGGTSASSYAKCYQCCVRQQVKPVGPRAAQVPYILSANILRIVQNSFTAMSSLALHVERQV